MRDSTRGQKRSPEAQHQSDVAKQRAARSIKISRINNGYLINAGPMEDATAVATRAEAHEYIDRFFDELESRVISAAIAVNSTPGVPSPSRRFRPPAR